ncbi:MAG: response regulator [Dehalococcoidales bacterium]
MSDKETLLIVDDEETIRRLLANKLSGEGYHCLEASSANRAMEALEAGVVGLVLLDIKMPGKSGVQLLPEIKSSYPDTVVVMATAITDTATALHCMRQGAYDYVTKPFNLPEVVLSVERALERRRLELENRDYQYHLEERVNQQAEKIRQSFLNAITALAYALEAKDRYTSGHSSRVAEVAVAIAGEMGLSREDIEKIRLAGQVHDIGKIGIKEWILNKPDRLTEDEFRNVKNHPELGEHILTPVIEDRDILLMVRHHHERHDGFGYPDGLSGEEIPTGARILAVSDTFDAMTSERPYRKAMSEEVACAEIEKNRGSQFDPEVVDAFLRSRKQVSAKGKGE